MGWLDRLFSGESPAIYAIEGRTATAESADIFQIPMVQACRQLISDTVSSFGIYETDDEGRPTGRKPIILSEPSPWENRSDLLERLINDMTRYGRGWLYVSARDRVGYPIAVELVSDKRVTATLDSHGQNIVSLALDGRKVSRDDLRQSPMILDDGPLGRAPLLEISRSLRQLVAAYEFSATFYGKGSTPNYALMSSTRMPPAQAKQLMDGWLEARDKTRPALLTGDLRLETFDSQSASDALLLDAIASFDATIARVMQIPPSLVNALSQSALTYSTTRDQYRTFLISLNTGYLHRLETVFSGLLPPGKFARFDTSELTRLDETELLNNSIAAYTAGLITLDEAREPIGREPTGVIQSPAQIRA